MLKDGKWYRWKAGGYVYVCPYEGDDSPKKCIVFHEGKRSDPFACKIDSVTSKETLTECAEPIIIEGVEEND